MWKCNLLLISVDGFSFIGTLQALFWTLFGKTKLRTLELSNINSLSEGVGTFLFAGYIVVAVLILLSALVGMLSNSYNTVEVRNSRNKNPLHDIISKKQHPNWERHVFSELFLASTACTVLLSNMRVTVWQENLFPGRLCPPIRWAVHKLLLTAPSLESTSFSHCYFLIGEHNLRGTLTTASTTAA